MIVVFLHDQLDPKLRCNRLAFVRAQATLGYYVDAEPVQVCGVRNAADGGVAFVGPDPTGYGPTDAIAVCDRGVEELVLFRVHWCLKFRQFPAASQASPLETCFLGSPGPVAHGLGGLFWCAARVSAAIVFEPRPRIARPSPFDFVEVGVSPPSNPAMTLL